MSRPDVTIVLSSLDSPTTFRRSLRGFYNELGGRGRIIVVDASRQDLELIEGTKATLIRRPVGTLAPVLWRDGLLESSTEFVAFSTTQMIPRTGWLSGLLETIQKSKTAGVGGPISVCDSLAPLDRAMYLLRYANYLPPVPDSLTFEPPGDNAIYRRSDLNAVSGSWLDGFWEIEVHKQLRSIGRETAIAHGAVVEFAGGYHLGPALGHRLAHARKFGAGRIKNGNLFEKLARGAVAPAVPPILLSRIVRNLQSRGEPLGPWIPSLPYLSLLLAIWSAGEATGAWFGSGKSRAA